MSRAREPRERWPDAWHRSGRTGAHDRELDPRSEQISQFVALAAALAARIRSRAIGEHADAAARRERHLRHLDWAVLAGQAALIQLALSQHQQRGGAGRLSRFVPWRVRS